MNWHHNGLSVFAETAIIEDDKAGQEALAQYIMRNAFGKNKKSFEHIPAEKFIA